MSGVLPEYTDEAVKANLAHPTEEGVRRRAALLLRVPAGERQGVEARVSQRCVRYGYERGVAVGELVDDDFDRVREDEVRAVLSRLADSEA